MLGEGELGLVAICHAGSGNVVCMPIPVSLSLLAYGVHRQRYIPRALLCKLSTM